VRSNCRLRVPSFAREMRVSEKRLCFCERVRVRDRKSVRLGSERGVRIWKPSPPSFHLFPPFCSQEFNVIRIPVESDALGWFATRIQFVCSSSVHPFVFQICNHFGRESPLSPSPCGEELEKKDDLCHSKPINFELHFNRKPSSDGAKMKEMDLSPRLKSTAGRRRPPPNR